jgi:hypothetical protein
LNNTVKIISKRASQRVFDISSLDGKNPDPFVPEFSPKE